MTAAAMEDTTPRVWIGCLHCYNCGHYESFRDYLEQLADDTAMFEGIPDVLQSYFDWDRFAADEAHSYATEDAPDGGVFIFAY